MCSQDTNICNDLPPEFNQLRIGKLMTKEDISGSGNKESDFLVIPGFKNFVDLFREKLEAAIIEASNNSSF